MINLLPPDIKKNYRYARGNQHLLTWIGIFIVGLAGALVLTAGGYLYMHQSVRNYTKQVASSNAQLQSQNLPKVQKEVTNISNNLKLLVQVFSKEFLFSDLLKRLGSVTPANTVLTSLSISQTQGAIDIVAQTASYNAATQLQVNLSDPKNQIFSKADIVSINCTNDTAGKPYPCTATLRALFATNNPFLFISSGSTTKAAL
jgi:Tfp pilus assembly protein PilN